MRKATQALNETQETTVMEQENPVEMELNTVRKEVPQRKKISQQKAAALLFYTRLGMRDYFGPDQYGMITIPEMKYPKINLGTLSGNAEAIREALELVAVFGDARIESSHYKSEIAYWEDEEEDEENVSYDQMIGLQDKEDDLDDEVVTSIHAGDHYGDLSRDATLAATDLEEIRIHVDMHYQTIKNEEKHPGYFVVSSFADFLEQFSERLFDFERHVKDCFYCPEEL